MERSNEGALSSLRQRRILQRLQEHEVVRVSDLATELGVSPMTIRRDLKALETRHGIQRVHGGALLDDRALSERPLSEREVVNAAEKRRIGRAAAELVQDGDTIIIGGGTTTAELARHLVDRQDLLVITPTINIAAILADCPGVTVLITGGVLLGPEMTLAGHFGEQALRALHAERVFFGVNAVDLERGLTSAHPSEIGVDQAMLHAADERILLADHTKFGHASTCVIGAITEVGHILTDDHLPADLAQRLRELGIEVSCV